MQQGMNNTGKITSLSPSAAASKRFFPSSHASNPSSLLSSSTNISLSPDTSQHQKKHKKNPPEHHQCCTIKQQLPPGEELVLPALHRFPCSSCSSRHTLLLLLSTALSTVKSQSPLNSHTQTLLVARDCNTAYNNVPLQFNKVAVCFILVFSPAVVD